MRIVGIIGNNASRSHSRWLLQSMQQRYGHLVEFELREIQAIPLFNVDDVKQPPMSVLSLNDAIEQADGVIISTSEYDHAITASLKSVLEWLSSARRPFEGKPVMIVGASEGALGSIRAQMNLRQILNAPGLTAKVMPGNEFLLNHAKCKFDDKGRLTDSTTLQFLDECIENFIEFIEKSS